MGWVKWELIPRGVTPTMHKQLRWHRQDHAGSGQRPYLHEELGPGGRAPHHTVHHADESLALTHLQQRKEWTTDGSLGPGDARISPPHTHTPRGSLQ